jgi:hypothetical protein
MFKLTNFDQAPKSIATVQVVTISGKVICNLPKKLIKPKTSNYRISVRIVEYLRCRGKDYVYNVIHKNNHQITVIKQYLNHAIKILYMNGSLMETYNNCDNNISGISRQKMLSRIRKIAQNYTASYWRDISGFYYDGIKIIVTINPERSRFLNLIADQTYSILYIPHNFRHDKEILLMIVKGNGMMLEYASYQLKDSKRVVLAAITNNKLALQFASDRLKHKKSFMSICATCSALRTD